MAEKPKKQLSEKQKEILARNNFKNKTPAERSAIGAKGAEVTNRIKAEKKSRQERLDWLDELLDDAGIYEESIEQIKKEVRNGNLRNFLALFALIKKPDTQTQQLVGSIGLEKVFISPKEQKETDKHIDDFINDTE